MHCAISSSSVSRTLLNGQQRSSRRAFQSQTVSRPAPSSLAPGTGRAVTSRHALSTGSRVPRRLTVNAFFSTKSASTLYEYEVTDIDGRKVKLDKFKGQVVLVVNLASQCGFTPQYAELSELYNKFNRDGFTILGFPCNQFGAQESGSNKDIKSFATSKYGVKFPLMSKVDVNGSTADPLFTWLKKEKGGILNSDIKWNFTKFLVNKDGKVVGRYGSTTPPSAIEADIVKALA